VFFPGAGSLLKSDSDMDIPDVPAVLLVGGMGTRLRSVVPSTPKPLAPVGRKTFLELLIQQLRCQGIRQLVMCTGYLAEQIEDKFADGHAWDVWIHYSREQEPLGTAGAVKLAAPHLQEAPEFVVMNGDSFLDVDFCKLIRFHRKHGGIATLGVFRVDKKDRYGTVQTDSCGRVVGFLEKTKGAASGLVNAGIYVFDRCIFEHIPEGPSSLERDVFPKVLDHGVYALEQGRVFIDIGTPEDYARAQILSNRLQDAAQSNPRAETE
jgi:NDP-sugar pyrophosphorylase family protein